MGSALGASGWASGGVSGMRAVGIAQTTYEGVTGALDVVTNFIPGGKAFKSVKSLIKASKMGHKGVLNALTSP